MCHALIIDDNMIISRAIQNRLEPLGFNSFDHVWTEQQAIDAAGRRTPDLIVIGDEVETGSAFNAAKLIAAKSAVPVLLVTGSPSRVAERLKQTVDYAGPFFLNQIETAVEIALCR